MSELKILKKEHKKLEAVTKKTTKKRLNDRASDSWKDLRELKKLKLQLKDKINQFSEGFEIINIEKFEEGKFPRKLFKVTLKKKSLTG